jgi:hypothetical protein
MIAAMEIALFAAGVLLIWLVFWDLFQSIVLPRPSPGWFRIGRYVIRGSWRVVRRISSGPNGPRYDSLLGYFAPAGTVVLLAVWLAVLMLAYGLIFYALRGELSPVPTNLGTAIYFAASCILTLGFGDTVAVGGAARTVALVAAASGLGAVALVVTYFFSLYGSYQRREVQVVMLQSVAGAPPSAVALLETFRRLDLDARLPELFLEWERWAADVLDTHVAYPLLGYFRSSHDNLTWIGALGSMLDAASLVLTTIEDVPRGEAERFRRVGAHLVEDISNLGIRYGVAGIPSADATLSDRKAVDRAAFDAAFARLAAAGYRLDSSEAAWSAFQTIRESYAARLEGMALFWAVRSTSWLGTHETPRSPAHPEAGPADGGPAASEPQPVEPAPGVSERARRRAGRGHAEPARRR